MLGGSLGSGDSFGGRVEVGALLEARIATVFFGAEDTSGSWAEGMERSFDTGMTLVGSGIRNEGVGASLEIGVVGAFLETGAPLGS